MKLPLKKARRSCALGRLSMIKLEPHADGVILSVRANAGAKKNAVTGEHDGAVKISVTQAPEKGKANKAIVEVICKSLGLKRSQVELLSGETSSHKKFLLRGAQPADIIRRLANADA